MANDKNHAKNPTSQLRSRIPLTHSERNLSSAGEDPSGNPWDALQDRQWTPHKRWSPRTYKVGTIDWMSVLVTLGLAALAIVLALLLT